MSEAALQRSVAKMLDTAGFWWQHTPNEGKRKPRTGSNLKRAGMKTGVPDILIFDRPTCGAAGVAIELKFGRNKTTKEQEQWLDELRARGWITAVCYSIDEVRSLLERCYGEIVYVLR